MFSPPPNTAYGDPMSLDPSTALSIARGYLAAGLSLIPISGNGSKKPACCLLPVAGVHPDGHPRRPWKPFITRRPTEEELASWYTRWGAMPGLAVVCGAVSGDLTAIDVDATDLVRPWLDRVANEAPGLLEKLVLVQTPARVCTPITAATSQAGTRSSPSGIGSILSRRCSVSTH